MWDKEKIETKIKHGIGRQPSTFISISRNYEKENIWCRETYSPLISSCGDVIIGLLVLKIFNAGWGDYMSNLLVFVSTSLIDNGV